ncbi:MAG TPA: M14-type cytosolic carboxypeptidase [Burkholderiaceae bacterium]|nr:M14-type cytosolic carboxypeptidase [Burkholderiaceae bacterium]
MNPITISSQFDSGAIDVVRADDPADIELKVRADNAAEFAQWFHFRLQGAAGTPVTLRFSNAGQCAYPKGWEGYQAVASHDRQHWQRVPTSFDGASLTVQFTPATNSVYLAYFEPYSWERHLDLIGSAAASDHVQVERLGATLDGRDIDVLHITDAASAVKDADKRQIWLIARQHPGETMAEWFIEGLLERLLDAADPVARVLLARCVFHVVPNMNPDGSVRGNLRTNGAGANLNREWLEPALDRSPEVWLVRRCMQNTSVDLFLDIHGDEALPYNFVAGAEGIVNFTPRLQQLTNAFKSAWIASCPDFQDKVNYGQTHATKANPAVATNWMAQAFDCLSFTIEMPFKDNADLPDPVTGWSGERARNLGAGVLQPVLAVLGDLRS